jgi:hypothetical protein
MKYLPVIFISILSLNVNAQHVPDSVTYSPGKFALYLQNNYTDPSARVRALYSWITTHIQYDNDSALYFNWKADHETKIIATLRRRKGVCENYASLLTDIAGRLQIPAYTVHGYPVYANKNKDNSHSWVAIQDKSEWYLFDPTWDAQSNTEKYYQVSPADFIQTHIPFDPLWQLMEKPLHYTPGTASFMYRDSVAAFLQLDSLQQLLASERRMKQSADQNSMTSTWQRFNQMNVAIIAGEQDMNYYNSAVDALNMANNYFNAFVQYRNQQFIPLKPDREIEDMLWPVDSLLIKALDHLSQLGKLKDNFQYDPETIRQRIASLDKKSKVQLQFLRLYFSTPASERSKLFYQQ